MAKISIMTLGCKVNQYESASIAETLKRDGHEIAGFADSVDIFIINTCTVTGKTDYQSRQLIRRAHRSNPAARIIVTGCYAQVDSAALARLPGVSLVAGTAEKDAIPEMIQKIDGSQPQVAVGDIRRPLTFSTSPATFFDGHTRAFLKIQDGCENFCSYCIVPHARGRCRSLEPCDVLDRLHVLAGKGYREAVLTGIHLGQYGRDLNPPTDLLSLLRRIEDSDSMARLRLSSIEPLEISDELISFLARTKRFCRHLHIPLQSGDDAILRAMNRSYTTAQFGNLIERLVTELPGIAIGIDVMTGFPGETEESFERTRAFLETLPAAYFHVFPYSRRPGTPAAAMPHQVKENVKKRRAAELRILGATKRKSFAENYSRKTVEVLLESAIDRETGLLKGLSDNYITVLVEGADPSLKNRMVTVDAYRTHSDAIVGRIARS
ncbi:MAG: tRNA (N(6)-L-threonylcarbamoyladenosine(37)-C(2))-methylthiotransferase MtaB [Deltaproteobacteria bacterium]|nr:tRNA (N(6)-L-threonylcarbamoyladenosine(37)-C(2))-methylthiotransferase MtaB [Deltaproteobacteria bacterium]